MKVITYQRHEHTWPGPEERTASLDVFVYDVPYLAACAVFPPFHLLNERLMSGGSQGGMSPGATWEPFRLTEEEYLELASALGELDPITLGDGARYHLVKYIFDPEFDHIQDQFEWSTAVSDKYREDFFRRQAEALQAHHLNHISDT